MYPPSLSPPHTERRKEGEKETSRITWLQLHEIVNHYGTMQWPQYGGRAVVAKLPTKLLESLSISSGAPVIRVEAHGTSPSQVRVSFNQEPVVQVVWNRLEELIRDTVTVFKWPEWTPRDA